MRPRHLLALFSLSAATAMAAAVPDLFVSLRGVAQRTTEVGEPVFVAVRVEAPEGVSLTLSSGKPSWTDLVTVELVGPSGSIRAAVLQAGPAEVTLDAENAASNLWSFSSHSTGTLTPGSYELRVRLDLVSASAASSTTLPIRLLPAGSAPDPVQRAVALATEHLAQNRPEEAARMLDPLLEKDPDNARLLTARAQACVMGDDWPSARLCVDRALAKATATQEGYPPIELTLMQQQLQAGPTDASSLPPAWTRLPERVLVRDWERGLRDLPALAPPAAAVSVPPAGPSASQAAPRAAPAPAERVAPVPTASAASPLPGTVPGRTPDVSAASPASSTTAASPSLGIVVPAAEFSDAKVISDRSGQWASAARAGSQYGQTAHYSAAQATGAPNAPIAGNTRDAWCPAVPSTGMDWLEVTFAEPVRATEVRVRQNDTPGAIVKVEAFEPDGTVHLWWEGVDPNQPGRVREIVWFVVRVPPTSYRVERVKLTLNLASGPGYKQVDAVQLVRASP